MADANAKGQQVPPLQAIYLTMDVNWDLTEGLSKFKYYDRLCVSSGSEDQATRFIIDIQLLDSMVAAKISHQLPST